jgi:hypothetical protein
MRKTSERRRGGDEREREMFRLRTVDGLTLGAIAARFGVGPERVRSSSTGTSARRRAGHPTPPGSARQPKRPGERPTWRKLRPTRTS